MGEIKGVRGVQMLFNQAKDVLRGRLPGDRSGLGLSFAASQAERPGVGLSNCLMSVLSHKAALSFLEKDLSPFRNSERHAGNLELNSEDGLVVDLVVCQVLRGLHVLKKDRIASSHNLALTSFSVAGSRLHAPHSVVGPAAAD